MMMTTYVFGDCLCLYVYSIVTVQVMGLVLASVFGTFVWDRFCTMILAPRIFKAMVEEGMKTTLADVLPIFKTAAGGRRAHGFR